LNITVTKITTIILKYLPAQCVPCPRPSVFEVSSPN